MRVEVNLDVAVVVGIFCVYRCLGVVVGICSVCGGFVGFKFFFFKFWFLVPVGFWVCCWVFGEAVEIIVYGQGGICGGSWGCGYG